MSILLEPKIIGVLLTLGIIVTGVIGLYLYASHEDNKKSQHGKHHSH